MHCVLFSLSFSLGVYVVLRLHVVENFAHHIRDYVANNDWKIYLSLISHFMMANIFPSIFTVGFVQVYKSKILKS